MVGSAPFQVQCYSSRHLNNKVLSGVMQKYIDRSEENMFRHHLIEKLGILYHHHVKRRTNQHKLNKLDKQSRDLMLNAEKKCCCIKSG
jgi:hypothetical protein